MVKIKIQNLKKVYKEKSAKDQIALRNINISEDINGILTFIGRNGAGKTTLIRIMSTELNPSNGLVSIDGIDIIKDPNKIRERISVIPQEGRLVPWMTPLQNIVSYLLWRGFSYKEAVSRAKKALKEFKLEKYMNKLPNKLSGGTKRKALVALAISSEADIVFLDEPTTGLDPVSRKELWSILSKLKNDHLIILTTHYLEEAEALSDKIGIIEKGRLIAIGTIDQLRNKIGYPYAIRIFSKNYKLKSVKGKLIKKDDGTLQIFSSEKEADRIAAILIRDKIKFSINPTSLEDIFYMFVGDINNEG